MTRRSDIPLKDTPSLKLLEQGFGGAEADSIGVADCMQLLRVSKRLLGYFYEHFANHEISPGKYSVLCELLATNSPMAPSALAERIGVRRPTVTGLLDGLCAQALVARVPDPNDRRRLSVELTAKGRRFMRTLLPVQFALMADVVGGLTDTERRQLRRTLASLEERVT
ncbi:MAG: MarR family winged helix-turn-helix transcriptional regulator [Pseudomonadales bacterium]